MENKHDYIMKTAQDLLSAPNIQVVLPLHGSRFCKKRI